MKASNAVRLTLPPWSKDEVQHLVSHCQEMVRKRMLPYVKHIQSKVYSSDPDDMNDEVQKDTANSTGWSQVDHVGAARETTHALPQVDCSDIRTENEATAVGVKSLAQSACSAWDYDEVCALRCALDTSTETDAQWSFLQDHVTCSLVVVFGFF